METTCPDQVFEEIYRSYAQDVFRFSLYLSGNWAQAQDLTSEAFVRAWTAAVPPQVLTAKAYLFVIARNLYLDSLRRRRPAAGEPSVEMADRGGSLEVSFEHREELAHTLEDLARIPEGDRAALVMAVFEEMGHEEVARALGISTGAVKSRIFRARLSLTELREERLTRRDKPLTRRFA